MGDGTFWKVAGTFVALLGAAAIIFQLNQGTLVQTGASTFGSVAGDAFAAAGTSPAGTAQSGSGSHSSPSGQLASSNKSAHSQQFTVV
jgi:hypothetical protein